jgi:hypothetical protein
MSTVALDTSKLAGTASFHVADVDLFVNNQTRKDAMKEGFAAAIMVPVSKFTKFEVTKVTRRRLRAEQEASVRQLAGHNINVAYAIDVSSIANQSKIVSDAKALTGAILQQKVKEKLTTVGYTGTIEAKSFTAAHPILTTSTSVATTSGGTTKGSTTTAGNNSGTSVTIQSVTNMTSQGVSVHSILLFFVLIQAMALSS